MKEEQRREKSGGRADTNGNGDERRGERERRTERERKSAAQGGHAGVRASEGTGVKKRESARGKRGGTISRGSEEERPRG